MTTASVFRPQRTWKGDTVSGRLDDYLLGEVSGVVMGGSSPQPVPRFPGVVSTEGMIGIARQQHSGITVQQHDRLKIDGVLYAVTGPKQWDFPNELTGTVPSHVWYEVEAKH